MTEKGKDKYKSQMQSANKQKPLISVIIPVFNGEKFISEAIDSILQQHYHPLEIIVVNDGSTDETKQILTPYLHTIRYIEKENAGVATARNVGVKAASGLFMAFLDADDIWHPEKLNHHLGEFDRYNDLDISLGLTISGEDNLEESFNWEFGEQQAGFQLLLGSSLIRKSAFEKVGLFDEELELGEDTDWFFRAREQSLKIAICEKVLLFQRKHAGNITNNKLKFNFYVFKVLKKAKDRKQADPSLMQNDSSIVSDMDSLMRKWQTVNR